MRRPRLRASIGKLQFRYTFPFSFDVAPRPIEGRPQRFRFTAASLPEIGLPPATSPTELPDIIIWGMIDWHFRMQRPQHLAIELAKRGHRVFYISPIVDVARRPGFTPEDVDAGVVKIRLCARTLLDIYTADPETIDQVLRQSLGLFVRWAQPQATVSLVQCPFWTDLADSMPNSLLVADVMDLVSGFSNIGPNVSGAEAGLLRTADLTVVTATPLLEHVEGVAKRVAIIRNGADVDHLSAVPRSVFHDPKQRKIIGYYGAIASWFDTDAVAKLAERLPECLILLVGADSAGAEGKLRQYPNIRFTGEVPYGRLPYYLHAFDVAIVPFKINALTRATNPVKVYEYLAAGKPVVMTRLPESAQFGSLIRTAVDPDGIVEETVAVLAQEVSTPDSDARRAFARANAWNARVEALCGAIAAIPKPAISVIVVAYNQLALTKQCLASIAERSHTAPLEVIVVDNASSDGTAEFLRAWEAEAPGRVAIVSETNLGFAGGVNRGLAATRGDILVVMNNDVIVTDGWVGTLAKHLRRDPKLGLVGPVTNAIGNEARVDIAYPSLEAMPASALAFTSGRLGQSMPIKTLAFFCVAMRRDVYEAVGDLDERFGQGYFEDDDYCRRVEAAGYTLRCAEDVFVHHAHSASFDALGDARRKAIFAANKQKYEAKWGTWEPHKARKRVPADA